MRKRLPVERLFRLPMVELLTRRADCSLYTLKPAHSSRLLPRILLHRSTEGREENAGESAPLTEDGRLGGLQRCPWVVSALAPEPR